LGPLVPRRRRAWSAQLAGFGGLLQVDGYAAYNRLAKGAGANDGVTLAACFAHVRRRFYELHVNESSRLATQTITTMAALWKVEADIRGKDPATRVKARQEKSAAIVARLFDLWETELPRLSGKSKLAEAIRYAISGRAALERFLSDGRVEIDSNIVERAIRPQTITRKNALFAGSAGGRTWATVVTLLQTALCRMRHRQVYADCRTMPNGLVFPEIHRERRVIGSA
jgi:transposase